MTTMQAAALAFYGAVIAISDSLVKIDGCSLSIWRVQFTIAATDASFHDGWFLRCISLHEVLC